MTTKQEIKSWSSKIMLNLDHSYKKLITHLQTMHNILILLCQCIICQNYSVNYSKTSGSLWNDYRNEINDSANEIDDYDNKINNKKKASKSFEYKTKIIVSTQNNNTLLDTEVVVSLKYLSSFWRFLDFPLIN